MSIDWNVYPCEAFYDELVAGARQGPRAFAGLPRRPDGPGPR